ncbi:hypothetical protein D3C72_2245720 [compost metagenome]
MNTMGRLVSKRERVSPLPARISNAAPRHGTSALTPGKVELAFKANSEKPISSKPARARPWAVSFAMTRG